MNSYPQGKIFARVPEAAREEDDHEICNGVPNGALLFEISPRENPSSKVVTSEIPSSTRSLYGLCIEETSLDSYKSKNIADRRLSE